MAPPSRATQCGYRENVMVDTLLRILAIAVFAGIAFQDRWPAGSKRYSGRIFAAYCAVLTIFGLVSATWYLAASGAFGLAMNVPIALYETRHGVEAPHLTTMYRQHKERKQAAR